ncbi:MAG TPA: ADP-ribosylglycohydrolase family protein, partial [Actinotalea sp.]|nr:ADP-ribosylglycohydrolase family protein [Actinotalea sp.]
RPGATSELTAPQIDRAAGVLLAQGVGDALGVPYEFATPPTGEPEMLGGGLGDLAPGEWSDDTQMAVCIARVAATGADLTSPTALDAVAAAFEGWLTGGASDVGAQTRAVLQSAARATGPAGIRLTTAAREYTASHPRSAGNGALMRTSIVGLTRLHDREHTAASARVVAELTHADPLALDSCVLWSDAVRRAVLSGHLDLAAGLDLLDAERRERWGAWIAEATGADPARFAPNGYTVTALQAAWAAITSTDDGDGDGSPLHVRRAITAAVHAGDDTDTVAAIAGGLLGARYGVSAVPAEWANAVHGWPGLRGDDLVTLARRTASAGA